MSRQEPGFLYRSQYIHGIFWQGDRTCLHSCVNDLHIYIHLKVKQLSNNAVDPDLTYVALALLAFGYSMERFTSLMASFPVAARESLVRTAQSFTYKSN